MKFYIVVNWVCRFCGGKEKSVSSVDGMERCNECGRQAE